MAQSRWYVLVPLSNLCLYPFTNGVIYGFSTPLILRASSKNVFLQQLIQQVLLGQWKILEGVGQLIEQLFVLINIQGRHGSLQRGTDGLDCRLRHSSTFLGYNNIGLL